MFGHGQTEVLVVGAGPVGMLTGLWLAEGGIHVRIIDEEWRTGAHSYACALHPQTLELLDQVGLADEVLARGRRLETIAFYDGVTRQAEMNLAKLPVRFPCVVVLPQSDLEDLLEQRLNQKWGVKVDWNHRLSSLAFEGQTVVATLDRLGGTVTGYSVPTWEWVVKKRFETRPAFLVGADGHESLVRRLLGISSQSFAAPEVYGVYEFEFEGPLDDELHVVLADSTKNVLWPLPGHDCRWSFESDVAGPPGEFPAKERRPWRFYDETQDRMTQQQLQAEIRQRAPWFQGTVKELDWSIEVAFEARLADRFGRGRCWLAGDAAHQTSPIGMQSMNVGLQEAVELAGALRRILREKAPLELLEAYHRRWRGEWEGLLGLQGELRIADQTTAWIRERRARILPCVPASGNTLRRLLSQVGLGLPD